jgi:hypothetical protein
MGDASPADSGADASVRPAGRPARTRLGMGIEGNKLKVFQTQINRFFISKNNASKSRNGFANGALIFLRSIKFASNRDRLCYTVGIGKYQ